MHNLIVLSLYTFFGLFVLCNGLISRKKGQSGFGKPPIHVGFFLLGKTCMGITWGFFIGQALTLDLNLLPVPLFLSWFATILLSIGIIFVVLAFINLGTQGKFGLSGEEATLITTGIYKVTRNPMYLGFFLIIIASCLYCPNLVNPICAVFAIVVHHKIVLAEEAFLSKRFLDQWVEYTARVRRYL